MLDILYNRASTKQATPIDVLFFGRFIDRSSSTKVSKNYSALDLNGEHEG